MEPAHARAGPRGNRGWLPLECSKLSWRVTAANLHDWSDPLPPAARKAAKWLSCEGGPWYVSVHLVDGCDLVVGPELPEAHRGHGGVAVRQQCAGPRGSPVADGLARFQHWQVDDPQTGSRLAVAEAFWPDGLQPGRGEPVVLELDPDDSDIERMQAIGYRVFTSISSLREHVDREAALDAGESRVLDGPGA